MSDYEIADRKDSRALTEFLQKEGQFLLPIVSLIETAQGAIDEVIDVAGRATIEAVLHLSSFFPKTTTVDRLPIDLALGYFLLEPEIGVPVMPARSG